MLTTFSEMLWTGTEKIIENALIESCAIHSRALVKFFYPYESKRPPRKTDAIVDDFFMTSSEWRNIYPKIPRELNYDNFGKFADKQIAHIIYSNEEKHRWNFTLISDILQPILEEFVELINKEQLGDRWSNQLDYQIGSRWETLKRIVEKKSVEAPAN